MRGTTTTTYQEIIGDLKIEDFKSSFSNKLRTQEETDIFNKENRHKIRRDQTIEYLLNDVEIYDCCVMNMLKEVWMYSSLILFNM